MTAARAPRARWQRIKFALVVLAAIVALPITIGIMIATMSGERR